MNLILWAWVDKLLISLAGGIFHVISVVYDVFKFLAKTSIFGSDDYAPLVNNVYTILGVVVLFVMAYSILTYIVDPEKDKGGASSEKMIKNVFISFIMIILCPFIFEYAFKIQNVIIEENVIGNFFNKDNSNSVESYFENGGNNLAATVFQAFFATTSGKDPKDVKSDGKYNGHTISLADAKDIAARTGSFAPFTAFANNVDDDEVDFNFLVCVIAGLYLGWIMVSFCFDLAVRISKLAFYQIIAPLCISCRILPNKDSIYKNWFKATINTFLQVFILIFIMTFGMYLINVVSHANVLDGQTLLTKAFILLGMVTFIKSSPKLIQEVFGIGDVKLGIKDKFKEGGGFLAASAIGGGALSAINGISSAWNGGAQELKNAHGFKNKSKIIGRRTGNMIKSTVAGGASGLVRGGTLGKSAGSFKDVYNTATKASNATVEKRSERESYRAQHAAFTGEQHPWAAAVGNRGAAMLGHLKDAGSGALNMAGFGISSEALAFYDKAAKEADSFKSASKGTYKNDQEYIDQNSKVARLKLSLDANKKTYDPIITQMEARRNRVDELMKIKKEDLTAEQKNELNQLFNTCVKEEKEYIRLKKMVDTESREFEHENQILETMQIEAAYKKRDIVAISATRLADNQNSSYRIDPELAQDYDNQINAAFGLAKVNADGTIEKFDQNTYNSIFEKLDDNTKAVITAMKTGKTVNANNITKENITRIQKAIDNVSNGRSHIASTKTNENIHKQRKSDDSKK